LVLTPSGQIEIEEFDVPAPAPNQLLVRTSLTQVSAGSEMNGIRRRRTASPAEQASFANEGLGYTAIGVVEEAGSQIDQVAVGDRVLCSGNHSTHWLVTPELEASEVVIPQQYNVQKLPDDLTDVEVAFCVLGDVALHGVRRAQIQIGESVAVHGLGVVGLLALQLCRLVGAQPLIGVDLVEERLDLARQPGASHLVNAGSQDAVESNELFRREIVVTGSYQTGMSDTHPYWPWTRVRNQHVILDLIRRRELQTEPLVSHVVPFTEAPDLFDRMMSGHEGWLSVFFTWD